MIISRRNFLTGALAFAATGAWADDDQEEYIDYPLDEFARPSHHTRGLTPSTPPDKRIAERIATSMPTDSHFAVMERLSQITETGSTGEVFNSRWKRVANPLIVQFFQETGCREIRPGGDCTPWCGATVAWCLKRAGLPNSLKPGLITELPALWQAGC